MLALLVFTTGPNLGPFYHKKSAFILRLVDFRTIRQDRNGNSVSIQQKRNIRINSQTHQYWKNSISSGFLAFHRRNTILVLVSTYVAFDGTKHNIMQGLSIIVWMRYVLIYSTIFFYSFVAGDIMFTKNRVHSPK